MAIQLDNFIRIDDQPIAAGFFDTGMWMQDFITPDSIDVQALYESVTEGLYSEEEKILALQEWVANSIQYKPTVKGKLIIDGHSSVQTDLWNLPSITANVRVGNCANKAFLLTSLLRNFMSPDQVKCILGNLYNGHTGGHAWVQLNIGGEELIVEPTMASPPVLVDIADRYEAVHLFNDQQSYVIEGRTVIEPYTACYSTWLVDYLDWAYIEGRK